MKDIKCPMCQQQGSGFKEGGRWIFECWACGFKTYLKLLAKKTLDKNKQDLINKGVIKG